jgi:hypothetical protein
MSDKPTETTPAEKSDPLVAVTVLVTPTRIGDFNCGATAQLSIPLSQAKTLAAMDPPRVRIDGV